MQRFIGIRENVNLQKKIISILNCFSEVNSGLFYKTAAEREKLLGAEREFITRRVNKIIELKKQVCVEKDGQTPGFVVINQKVIITLKNLIICLILGH